jgi:hypothetical protein
VTIERLTSYYLERVETLSCTNLGVDYSHDVDIDFSYKGKLTGINKFLGGKGGGGCGGIFNKGDEYVIVVYKCDDGLYTYMCSDNEFLSNAKHQVEFLNTYFKKDYQLLKPEFFLPAILLTLIILSAAGLVAFNYYKKRLRKINRA